MISGKHVGWLPVQAEDLQFCGRGSAEAVSAEEVPRKRSPRKRCPRKRICGSGSAEAVPRKRFCGSGFRGSGTVPNLKFQTLLGRWIWAKRGTCRKKQPQLKGNYCQNLSSQGTGSARKYWSLQALRTCTGDLFSANEKD